MLLASVALLSACDAERRGAPAGDRAPDAVPPRAACVPRGDGHAGICGLAPTHRQWRGGTAYKLATVGGESFWVVLPDDLSAVVAVPSVPIRLNAELTTARPREAAERYCDGFPACEATAVGRVAVPSGVLTRWDDASGTIRDLGVSTLALGRWTLVMVEPDARRAERVARALRWSLDRYPRVVSTDTGVPVDADWAGVALWVPGLEDHRVLIEIVPGCALSTKQPDLGGSDAGPELERHQPDTAEGGRWCADGRYAVDVSFAGRSTLEILHAALRIVQSGR